MPAYLQLKASRTCQRVCSLRPHAHAMPAYLHASSYSALKIHEYSALKIHELACRYTSWQTNSSGPRGHRCNENTGNLHGRCRTHWHWPFGLNIARSGPRQSLPIHFLPDLGLRFRRRRLTSCLSTHSRGMEGGNTHRQNTNTHMHEALTTIPKRLQP